MGVPQLGLGPWVSSPGGCCMMLWGGKNPHQGLLMMVAREEPGSGQRVLLFCWVSQCSGDK